MRLWLMALALAACSSLYRPLGEDYDAGSEGAPCGVAHAADAGAADGQ